MSGDGSCLTGRRRRRRLHPEWRSTPPNQNRQIGNAMPRSPPIRLRSSLSKSLPGGLYFVLMVSIVSSALAQNNSDVMPPVIVDGPPPHRIYNPKGKTTLPCKSNGSEPLRHEWFRDGRPLEPNPAKFIIGQKDGDLNLNEPEEGFYQCRVENEAGVAVSNITHLQSAACEVSTNRQDTKELVEAANKSLVIHCSHVLRCIPPASFKWEYSDSTPVKTDDRVTVVEDGSLVFRYLLPSDANRDGDYYKCVAYNPVLKRDYGGSRHRLTVSDEHVKLDEIPTIPYSSNSTVRVLEGQPFSLSCIFNTRTTDKVNWSLPNRTVLSLPVTGRLEFPSARPSDAGNYTCIGTNGVVSSQKTMKVIVDALPRIEPELEPQKVELGGSARFRCNGVGRPRPTISWIVNGTQYNSTQYNGTQYQGSRGYYDDETLVLLDVQGTASISCNASNKYGYQLSSSRLLIGAPDVATRTTSQYRPNTTASFYGTTTARVTTVEPSQGSNTSTGVGNTVSPPHSGRPTGVRSFSMTTTVSKATENGQGSQVDVAVSSGGFEKLYLLAILPVLLTVLILLVFLCRRRRKRNQSYSMNAENTVELAVLKTEIVQQLEANCDSDDSGYDDVSRKPRLKQHTKRLSDTPEESYL